jgi:hypothetical protein
VGQARREGHAGVGSFLSGRHTWEPTGVSTPRLVPVVDPAIIRGLDVGQAAYLYRGGVTYLHVKPPAETTSGQPPVPGYPAQPGALGPLGIRGSVGD